MTFGKFGKQRQGAKEQLKLHPNCELCLQRINRAKGTSKKHTTVRGFRQHLEGQDADLQLADLHRSCRRHDLSFTCRLFVACVTSVFALVCWESWDGSNFQFSSNFCGTACYAGYKQSYVRHETKSLSPPVLHFGGARYSISQTLNPRIGCVGQGKDEASKSLQPVTLPATTSPAADYMLNSSDVLVLRRVHSTSKSRDWKRGRLHASTMFLCHVKVVLLVATNIPELPGKQRHLIMSKLIINVNLEIAVRLHRLWL